MVSSTPSQRVNHLGCSFYNSLMAWLLCSQACNALYVYAGQDIFRTIGIKWGHLNFLVMSTGVSFFETWKRTTRTAPARETKRLATSQRSSFSLIPAHSRFASSGSNVRGHLSETTFRIRLPITQLLLGYVCAIGTR